MTIAKDFASKLSVAFVAAAMLFSFAAPTNAQTTEDLQQMINDLLAQIAQLEGSTSGSGDMMGACASIPAPLTIGSQGADVTALQNVLISNGYSIPAGATGYFGMQTQSALAAWQADSSISPAVGYYGPISKAALDASCTADDDMMDEDDDMMDDDDDMMMDLQGEGTLDDTETDLDDASDSDIMEGEDEAEIGTLTLAAEDGDILVERLTFTLADAGGDANEEDEPWDVFTEFGLWVDGDMIASFEADDEDEYLSENTPFEFRFTNIGVVIEEDEEVEFVISASVMNSVDGADAVSGTAADWDLDATEVRYFDADDVSTDDALTVSAVDFSIEEEGADDRADLESSSADPDQATLEVDDNSSDSDEFDVFIFDIEVDEDSNDLIIDDFAYATVTISNPVSAASAITGDDVIEAVYMTIDGEKVEGDETPAQLNASIAANNSQEVLFEFDFDELELESDTDYEVVVSIVFRGQDDNYGNGVGIEVSTDGADWDVDGVEEDGVLSGTADSETHTLSTAVPVITDVSSETDRNEDGDAGTISFEFTIEAQGDEDVVFDTADIVFTTQGGAATTTAVSSFSDVDGDVDQSGSTWTIQDGDEATFVLDVTFTTGSSTDNGTYRVTLDTVAGVEVDETSAGMSLTN